MKLQPKHLFTKKEKSGRQVLKDVYEGLLFYSLPKNRFNKISLKKKLRKKAEIMSHVGLQKLGVSARVKK